MSRRAKKPAAYADDAALLADLLAQLNARLAELIAARRTRSVADPALGGLVITDVEVDELVSSDLLADEATQYDIGSLWGAVQPRLPEDSEQAAALRWIRLRDRFQLSAFEMEALLVCLAPEVQRSFERVFGFLNDNIAQRAPTTDLLLRLLAPQSTHSQLRALFCADSRLLRLGLLQTHDAGGRTLRDS